MKKAIILSGVPGSGKSTWAEIYKNNHQNTYIIASDNIRYELGGAYQYFKEDAKVWELFTSRANDLAKKYDDVHVLLDSTCLTNELRLRNYSKLEGFDEIELVFLDVDDDVCTERNKLHVAGKVVRDEPLLKMMKQKEQPNEDVYKAFTRVTILKNWGVDKR